MNASRLVPLLVLFILPDDTLAEDPLGHWHLRRPRPFAVRVNDVIFGNGLYVAVGENGLIATSPDARHWTEHRSETHREIWAISFGNERFVARTDAQETVVSSDGLFWRAFAVGHGVEDIEFGAGRFLSVGGGAFWQSSDGMEWSLVASNSNAYRKLAFGDDRFIALGHPGGVAGSAVLVHDPIGSSLSLQTNQLAPPGYGDVAYGNGTFVAVMGDSAHFPFWSSSTDGLAWSFNPVERYPTTTWSSIAFGNGVFVVRGSLVHTSLDGKTRVNRGATVPGAICFDGQRFVAVSSSQSTVSDDGVYWRTLYQHDPDLVCTYAPAVTANGTTFLFSEIAASNEAKHVSLISTNGVQWSFRRTPSAPGSVSHIVKGALYAGGKFIANSDWGVFFSTDGASWRAATLPEDFGQTLANLSRAGGRYYVRTPYRPMLTSSDGETWDWAEFAATFSAAADNGNIIVAVDGANILHSPDGKLWRTNYQSHAYLSAVVWANGRFVAVGGSILTSTDGMTWESANAPTNVFLSAIADGGGRLVAVGRALLTSIRGWAWRPSLLTSTDGLDWRTQVLPVLSDRGLTSVAWTGESFLALDHEGTIVQSDPLSPTAPMLHEHSLSTNAPMGTEVSLDVLASGTSPLSYKWFKDGVPVSSETNSYLFWKQVGLSDAGNYFCVVSNTVGLITSAAARITVSTDVAPANLRAHWHGHPELELTGTPGRRYRIEATENVADSNSWTVLQEVRLHVPTHTVPDLASPVPAHRFYRARLVP